jgi:hypothetical protein
VSQTPSSGTTITPSPVVDAGRVTSTLQAGVELKPFDTGAGKTGELRFDALSGGNYVGFKVPDAMATSRIWTLPAADGAAGQYLTSNGAGALAWASSAGGGDMLRSANLSDLDNVATARGNPGPGSLTTLSTVCGAEIVDSSVTSTDIADATIANAVIAGTAAIATSKLSG